MAKLIVAIIATFLPFALAIAGFAAWLTHVVFCLATGAWGFLLVGALIFPIAIVHGVGLWFGWFH